ncbi:uncharacterized protein LOC112891483 [Panicum hallii]|jgi:hypothetical protein|uniref:uncharacterized protein LOC112891483 n=1 Tax=Panicum hallii TaxID=206008 RepID=UPI000DF4E9AE|nr:uncharacterized protein LOC112891483 [Panicum hallii]
MEMEVESTWKGLFQRRLVLASRHCDRVHGLLLGAIEVVDDDVRNWRRHEGRPCAEEAQRALEGASAELGLALASVGAARHLALRGGAPCPSAPLDSVDDLAGDPAVWCALERLEKAAGIATRVHDGLEGARGHLRAAALLAALDGVGGGEGEGGDSTAPWEQSPCFSEQLNGAMELGEAMLKAGELVAETAAAREAAFGFISGVK